MPILTYLASNLLPEKEIDKDGISCNLQEYFACVLRWVDHEASDLYPQIRGPFRLLHVQPQTYSSSKVISILETHARPIKLGIRKAQSPPNCTLFMTHELAFLYPTWLHQSEPAGEQVKNWTDVSSSSLRVPDPQFAVLIIFHPSDWALQHFPIAAPSQILGRSTTSHRSIPNPMESLFLIREIALERIWCVTPNNPRPYPSLSAPLLSIYAQEVTAWIWVVAEPQRRWVQGWWLGKSLTAASKNSTSLGTQELVITRLEFHIRLRYNCQLQHHAFLRDF